MKNHTSLHLLTGVLLLMALTGFSAPAGRVSMVEGTAQILRKDSDSWRPLRPNMPVSVGDQLYTYAESFVELRYQTGAVVRLSEETKISVTSASEKGTATSNPVGDVWVNMQKLVGKGKKFELSTPTATAAIRGTVFHSSTGEDSATAVSVYTGKVAVGPSAALVDKLKKEAAGQKDDPLGEGEVPGPVEIPGPYEVSLSEWRAIVAGQRISVRKDGKFAQDSFDTAASAKKDAFVKKCMALDTKESEKHLGR